MKFLCEDVAKSLNLRNRDARFLVHALLAYGAIDHDSQAPKTGSRGRPKKFYKPTLKGSDFLGKLQELLSLDSVQVLE